MVGRLGPQFRSHWSGAYVHTDGSPLYSGIQKKKYRDVGWSTLNVGLCLMPLSVMIAAFMGEPGEVIAVKSMPLVFFCLAVFPVSAICLRQLFSDLRDSQLIHVAREAGIADDVFDHDDDEIVEEEAPDEEPEAEDDRADDDEGEGDETAEVIDFPERDDKEAFWA